MLPLLPGPPPPQLLTTTQLILLAEGVLLLPSTQTASTVLQRMRAGATKQTERDFISLWVLFVLLFFPPFTDISVEVLSKSTF